MSLTFADIASVPQFKADWRRLFDGYNVFYKRQPSDEVSEAVWAWLNDPGHDEEGVLALLDGKPVGLAHFRRQPRPGFGVDIGFLDDLFVDPQVRGQSLGRKLIEHVAAVGRARGWGLIRWTTADDNYTARILYDRLAKKTTWNLYEMVL